MILSVGEILIDAYKTKDTTSFCVGGAPFNVAVAVKRAGGKIGFVGKVGDDNEGSFILESITKYSLDSLSVSILQGHKTTVAEVSLDENGERIFKFFREDTADYQLSLSDVDLVNICPSILHLGTLMLNEKIGKSFALDLMNEARECGTKISVDVNFRDDLFKSKSERNEVMMPFIEGADFLKMGLDEIIDYTGASTLSDAVNLLPFKSVLFVTDGSKGSHVFFGDKHSFVPSIQVQAIDTTGAGDAFWGTALAGIDSLLQNHRPLTIDDLAQIAKSANIAGAEAVTHLGAI